MKQTIEMGVKPIGLIKPIKMDYQLSEQKKEKEKCFVFSDPYGKASGSSHRSLEVLELFSVLQKPLTVNEISDSLNYPQSSTSVLLHGLAKLGYLYYDRKTRSFEPTPRIIFLGMWVNHKLMSQSSLLEFMHTLAVSSGQVACLGMLNGIYAQYLHIAAARTPRIGFKPGLLRPVFRSAIGKVLLSNKSDNEIKKMLHYANAVEPGSLLHIEEEKFASEINSIREKGYAESVNAATKGAYTIAQCLPVEYNSSVLAVSISVDLEKADAMRPFLKQLLDNSIESYFSANN